ncbi:MAG: hypothetical protein AAFZ58_17290 [Pseudomonadota bacterium]
MTENRQKTAAVATLIALLGAWSAADACEYPKKPDIPDGRNASEKEMVESQRAIKAYMTDMSEYRSCLDTESQAAKVDGEDPNITAQRDRITAQRHNAAVDEENRHVEAFNEQVRAFKAENDK